MTRLPANFQLGPHRILPAENRIVRPVATVQVEPKVMAVLVHLAESGGVVTREALIERVWEGVVVTDHVLSRSISELRRALADDHRQPLFVETIRKRGYRLVAPVERMEPAAAPAPLPEQLPEQLPEPQGGPAKRRKRVPWLRFAAAAAFASISLSAWSWWGLGQGPDKPQSPAALLRERAVTSFAGSELDPALAPDGRSVAFAWDGPEGRSFDIYTKLLDADRPLRLTDHPGEDKNPNWSPDGTRLAFVRAWIEGSGLWVVPVDGAEKPQLLASTASGDIPDLIWTPDGRALIYVDRASPAEPFAIHRLDLTTLERTQLTSPTRDFYGDRDIALSADGETLAFARATLEGAENLFVLGLEKGEPAHRLTADHDSITGIEWLGDEILFSSNRIDVTRLWRVNLDGELQPVLGFGERASDPSLRGDRLAYERRAYTADIWRARRRPDGSWQPGEPFLTSTRVDMTPSFSPDGRQIAFVSERAGVGALWLCDHDGDRMRRLAAAGSRYPRMLAWSPDGERIAFVAGEEDLQVDVSMVTVKSGVVQRLTNSRDLESAPTWSGDGQTIYFGSNRSGDWQVWRIGVGGGATAAELEQVTTEGAFSAFEWQGSLCLVQPRTPGFLLRSVAGGPARRVLAGLQPGRSTELAIGTNAIWVRSAAAGRSTVVRVDPLTGRLEPQAGLEWRQTGPRLGFSISPDGQTALFTKTDVSDSDVLYVDGIR